jgi:hypothetical protein
VDQLLEKAAQGRQAREQRVESLPIDGEQYPERELAQRNG